ncbi:MAG TPA: L,D-transpeptidase family protein [Thermotogota bacterium]|nr:L,D-transpeptidase family protein [Thermotogota bacterium]HPJ89067.1 L,D-transpeptidase family protein [Thermotogota bacterium]HPR95119.1 L,D-transpeptidase family protein [Thermotogota bacterium]
MKQLIFLLLILCTGMFFSIEVSVFPDIKTDELTTETKKYLYCLIKLEDEEITSSSLFIMGKDLFLPLSTFYGDKKLFSIVEIPEASLLSGEEYELYINLETKDGITSERRKLLALNGLLMPYQPSMIPVEETPLKSHYVLSGEYLYRIAGEYGVSQADLELLNPEKSKNLHAGDILKIGEVHFRESPYTIRVSLALCTLTLYYMDTELLTFPVAVGRNGSTTSGIYSIKRKVEDPALYWEGEYITPLSPINGLGKWWLELSNPQYGIHGTNKPWEIGKRISHGCIRMWNDDVSLLQKLIPVGTTVIIQ